jgi:hypothetical protein
MQEATEGYVESYSGISVISKVTIVRHAEDIPQYSRTTLSFAITNKLFLFWIHKPQNHMGELELGGGEGSVEEKMQSLACS